MLDDKDIKKLKGVLTTKEDLEKSFSEHIAKEMEVFATKQDLENFVTKEEFKEAIDGLHSAIDAYAKKVDDYTQEMIMLAHKVDRHEKWIHQIAEKLGIKLEY